MKDRQQDGVVGEVAPASVKDQQRGGAVGEVAPASPVRINDITPRADITPEITP